MNLHSFDLSIVRNLYRPAVDSHKGQNGRVLVIGGSELFHAAAFWAAEVAGKVVDLVHFTSPSSENNDLVRIKSKEKFWSGIVVEWADVEEYIQEDDAVLVGPGMVRGEGDKQQATSDKTAEIVNSLFTKFPEKKWVVDGGALQEVDPGLLNGNMIITPHQGEFARLASKIPDTRYQIPDWNNLDDRIYKSIQLSKILGGVTILTKGKEDVVCSSDEAIVVSGGNAGMTKGGTGDVLAGLVTALYAKNDPFLAAQVGSYVNKKAGEKLAEKVGVYFNAGDLVGEVPKVLAGMMEGTNA